MNYYFTNNGTGIFTDGIVSLKPNDCIIIEDGKESKTVNQAWKDSWLSKTTEKPENAVIVSLLADKKPTVATNAKPKK